MAIKQNDARTQQALERKPIAGKLAPRVLSVAETRTVAAGVLISNPKVWVIKPTAE